MRYESSELNRTVSLIDPDTLFLKTPAIFCRGSLLFWHDFCIIVVCNIITTHMSKTNWDKAISNSFWEPYANPGPYYFHNIEMAEEITRKGREAMKQLLQEYENLQNKGK